ncbi:MAG: sensor histidine kinase N-terminal domain-containing protein, partial [Paracoccaceae bacterium]|nr:sensor histidine kinase N-terminal domain-containing protein [Paracoccaceae bacterium]
TQDAILGAATTAIADQLRSSGDGVEIDLPYSTFAMLGAMGQESLFYRIDVGNVVVTGYDDLPLAPHAAGDPAPAYVSVPFRGYDLRLATTVRSVLVEGRPVAVTVAVGQTRLAQAQVATRMAARAALLGLGFFALSVPFALLAARSTLAPIDRLADAVARRGPRDLRPVRRDAPSELLPLIGALNGFVARLRAALTQTETFIAEAAHHIRTPLATLRTEAELVLRQAQTPEDRARLRRMIRAAEESARSAGQLLDHAMVLYRADQREDGPVDLNALLHRVAESYAPTADMKDITLHCIAPDAPVLIRGDALLVESALRNLLDNGVKYSPPETTVVLGLDISASHA